MIKYESIDIFNQTLKLTVTSTIAMKSTNQSVSNCVLNPTQAHSNLFTMSCQLK